MEDFGRKRVFLSTSTSIQHPLHKCRNSLARISFIVRGIRYGRIEGIRGPRE